MTSTQISLDDLKKEIEENKAMDENTKKLCLIFFNETGWIAPPLFAISHYGFGRQQLISQRWKQFYEHASREAWRLFFHRRGIENNGR